MNLKRRTKVILVIVFIFVAFVVIFPFIMDREKVALSPEVRSRLPGSFIRLEEGFVHYELVGPRDGQVVVLVSGFPSTYMLWDQSLAGLTAAGFRVLRFDLFGAGSSDRPRAGRPGGAFPGRHHSRGFCLPPPGYGAPVGFNCPTAR
jgi:hypothetical protein